MTLFRFCEYWLIDVDSSPARIDAAIEWIRLSGTDWDDLPLSLLSSNLLVTRADSTLERATFVTVGKCAISISNCTPALKTRGPIPGDEWDASYGSLRPSFLRFRCLYSTRRSSRSGWAE